MIIENSQTVSLRCNVLDRFCDVLLLDIISPFANSYSMRSNHNICDPAAFWNNKCVIGKFN